MDRVDIVSSERSQDKVHREIPSGATESPTEGKVVANRVDDDLLIELVEFFRRYVDGDSIDAEFDKFQANDLLARLEEIAESR